MSSIRQRAGLAALLAASLGMGSCTLVKPVAGLFTGPAYAASEFDGSFRGGGNCHDGCGVVAYLAVSAAVGATAGLVTGVISDWQTLFGEVGDPTHNWWNPFGTNTSPR
jgi:hypothetical protein